MLPFSLTPTTASYSVIPIPYFLNLPPTVFALLSPPPSALTEITTPATTTYFVSSYHDLKIILSFAPSLLLLFSSLFFSYNGSSRLNIRIRRAPEIPVEKIPFWNFRFRQTRIFSSFFAQRFELSSIPTIIPVFSISFSFSILKRTLVVYCLHNSLLKKIILSTFEMKLKSTRRHVVSPVFSCIFLNFLINCYSFAKINNFK